ncbi:MAG: heat-inducible transcription repressor HrcA [Clostridia bacterium]|nr:heat-inducible transcription repressor HrcA [Clostridia bacterium]
MILDFRKGRILAAIVESYIHTGEPVGSKALAEMLGNCVSSATIRNDMAVLTAAGYLAQPHTSAGRLPTPQALRLYVEEMMDRRPLTLQEKVDIKSALSAVAGDATRMMEDACRVLADLTGLCAVACRPDNVGTSISRIEVMQMSPRNMGVLLVQDNGFMRTHMCRCQRDIPTKFVQALSDYLSRRFLGGPLSAVTVEAMQTILIDLGEAGLAVAPILSAFYELALECAASRVTVAGAMNLLRQPDYPTGRALAHHLSDRQNVSDLLAQSGDGVQIILGGDSDPLFAGSAVMLIPYSLGKRGQGTIGVVGPIRQDYATLIPRLEYFAAHLGRMMSELFDDTEALDFG